MPANGRRDLIRRLKVNAEQNELGSSEEKKKSLGLITPKKKTI